MCVCGKTFLHALPCTGFHCVWLPLAPASMEMAKREVFIWPTLGISDTYLYTYPLHTHMCTQTLALVGFHLCHAGHFNISWIQQL